MIDACSCMQWLVHIANVVDQETDGSRDAFVFVVYVLHHSVIVDGFLVIIGAFEPLAKCWDGF